MKAREDRVWKALADETRRAILDALSQRALTTGELVERFPSRCRTAVMKHLDVLEAAELIVVKREGRLRWNHINPAPIQQIYERWVSHHIRWTVGAASRLKRAVESASPSSRDSEASGAAAPKPRRKQRNERR